MSREPADKNVCATSLLETLYPCACRLKAAFRGQCADAPRIILLAAPIAINYWLKTPLAMPIWHFKFACSLLLLPLHFGRDFQAQAVQVDEAVASSWRSAGVESASIMAGLVNWFMRAEADAPGFYNRQPSGQPRQQTGVPHKKSQ